MTALSGPAEPSQNGVADRIRTRGREGSNLAAGMFTGVDFRWLPLAYPVAAAFLLDIRDGTKGRQRPRFTLADATKNRKPAGVMANRARAVLGSFYGWAGGEEERRLYGVTANPLLGLERIYSEPEPQPRVYSPAELRSIFVSANGVKELRHLVPPLRSLARTKREARSGPSSTSSERCGRSRPSAARTGART